MTALLYIIGFPNGKLYVGITTRTVEQRFWGHTKSRLLVGNAIRKYGPRGCQLMVLAKNLSWEEACEWERFWIRELDSKAPHGYNLTDGGRGIVGWKCTSVWKKKMSQIRHQKYREDPAFLKQQQVYVAKACAAAIMANTGRHFTGEHLRRKQVAMAKAQTASAEARRGKHLTGKSLKAARSNAVKAHAANVARGRKTQCMRETT